MKIALRSRLGIPDNHSDLVYETLSFDAFMDSWDELSVFSQLNYVTENDPWTFIDEAGASHLLPALKISQSVAAKLTMVYLVSIAEVYVKDALTELLDRRIRKINFSLMGSPMPSNENEDVEIEISLAAAEDDKRNPFFMFSDTTRKYISDHTRNRTVEHCLDLLESLFGIEVQDRKKHEKKWEKAKKLRNKIVHHRAYSRDNILYQPHLTISDILIPPKRIQQASAEVFEFTYAIESGICKSVPGNHRHRIL